MEHRKAALGRAWRVSSFALLAWLMLLAPARAGERVVADLDGDRRGDQMTGLLARPGPSFATSLPADDTDPGFGSGDAILATSSDAAPAARGIFPDRRVPARVTRATALSESRAPPRL
jgi:hypothetical protein